MDNVYLYPKVFPSENPYISDLENSLATHYYIVNKEHNTHGVFDLYRYLLKTDIYYFNWIENIPSRRYGKIQVIIFVCFIILAKTLRKKIVWTLHNKYSHDKKNSKWTDFMFDLMFRHSDFILTHSQSGIGFSKEKYPKFVSKVKYFIHPVKKLYKLNSNNDRLYDFFIWGTIWPYKGVIEFLKFLEESGNKQFKILIAGICINDQVRTDLERHLRDNVTYLNKFFEFDEIADFASKSKFTLFTYHTDSVLSSGSLMDSIAMQSVIIGPDAGAFKDLSFFGFVKTYNTYEDIVKIINNYSKPDDQPQNNIEAFWKETNWDSFGDNLFAALGYSLK